MGRQVGPSRWSTAPSGACVGPTVSVVTGGAGFIGRHLVDALLARGDEVRVLDVAPEPANDWSGEVDYRCADVTDRRAVRDACAGADVVFHAAALVHTRRSQRERMWAVNVGGTERVIDACVEAGVARLVFVGAAIVVCDGREIMGGDESLPYAERAVEPFTATMVGAERRVRAANDPRGLRTVALRPTMVFGPDDPYFLPALLGYLRQGRARVQIGRGRWLWDATYVTNLIDALLLADEALRRAREPDVLGRRPSRAVAGGAYFISNDEPMPFWEFVERMAYRLGLPPPRFALPHQLAYTWAALRESAARFGNDTVGPPDGLSRFSIRQMCTSTYFSIEAARRDLGYEPAVSLADGIERTCAYVEAMGLGPTAARRGPHATSLPSD